MAIQPTTVLGSFRFGDDFELDVRAYELRSAGIPLKLKPIPMELLLFLLERRGELVTREKIVERIWGAGVFLDTDNSINGAVSKIRQVLRDDAAQPRFVQTVTGRGYRFIAPVTEAFPSLPHSAPAAPVDVLIGKKVTHYRILELLGGGGMGVVYKAEDLKLGRRVAIKFLPDELATDPKALARLESEARAASALDHRNICAIYELDEHDGQPFIVMQLLEGQTLQERMEAAAQHRTSLPLATVLTIAMQVAEGLQAAHKAGFIHRDIKPGNIFITSVGEVKILDFGLAQNLGQDVRSTFDDAPSTVPPSVVGVPAASHRLRLSMTETHMGTAFYMSPEQVRGEKLDARTDIFSFGLVLYQMLSGHRAFPGNTTRVVHDGILNNAPLSLHEINATLPAKLVAVVDKCLEKNRSERFQRISEVLSTLTQLAAGEEPRRSYFDRHKWQALAFVVLLIACAAALRYRAKPHPRHLSQADTVVVSDFVNTTGDKVFDGTLKQAVALQLQQTPWLHVMGENQLVDTLRLMNHPAGERLSEETAREVCLRANSRGVVTGSIAPARNGYELRIRVADCQSSDVLASATITAKDRTAVLRALDDAANSIRSQLGESLASLQKFNTPLDEGTTSSLEALQAFSEARYEELHKGFESAVPYYKLAVELDPQFALAYASLAQTYYNLRYRDLADKACEKALDLKDRASRHERLRIEGLCYFSDTGDVSQSLTALTDWSAEFPSDWEPHRKLNALYRSTGHYEQALEESKRYATLAPDNSAAYFALVMAYVRLNDADHALAAFRAAQSRNLDSEPLEFAAYMALSLKGDTEALRQQVEAAKANKNSEDTLLQAWACTQADHGHEQAAKEDFQRAIKLAESLKGPERAGMWAAEMALDEAELGRSQAAQQSVKQALALSSGREVQGKSAFVLALAGKTSQASAIADRLDRQYPHDTMLHEFTLPTIRATAALQQKKWGQAIELLKTNLDWEMGGDSICCLWPVYIRGLAYLQGRHPKEAATQFQKLIEHPGTVNLAITGSLTYLQLARAQVMMGDTDGARISYRKFLSLWKDADPDLAIDRQAQIEYASLH